MDLFLSIAYSSIPLHCSHTHTHTQHTHTHTHTLTAEEGVSAQSTRLGLCVCCGITSSHELVLTHTHTQVRTHTHTHTQVHTHAHTHTQVHTHAHTHTHTCTHTICAYKSPPLHTNSLPSHIAVSSMMGAYAALCLAGLTLLYQQAF